MKLFSSMTYYPSSCFVHHVNDIPIWSPVTIGRQTDIPQIPLDISDPFSIDEFSFGYIAISQEKKDGLLTIAKNSWIADRVFRCGPQSSLEADFPRLIVFSSGHRRRFFPFALARQQLQAAGVVEAPKVWIKRWFHLVFPTSTTRTLGVMGVLQRSIYHMVIMPTGEKSICPLFFALWSQDFSKCSTIFWKINDRFLTSKLQADDQLESTAVWTFFNESSEGFHRLFLVLYEQNFDRNEWSNWENLYKISKPFDAFEI